MSSKKERVELQKSLGPGAVWAVAVGSIIGWGCFLQGSNWTVRAGGPLPLVLGFLVGGLLMIVIGLSYSYMIAKFPVAGGEFAYAYKGFGKVAAYICGWMLSLGYLSIVALNATALPVLIGYLLPNLLDVGYMYTIAGYDVYFGEVALSCFFIILFGIMNYKGAKSTGKLQLAMVLIMCAAVLVSIFGTVFTGSFNFEDLTPISNVGGVSGIGGFLSILALAPFLYVGFDCIPQAAEEYDFPAKKAKLLICSALIVGAVIYCAMAIVTDIVIPWTEVQGLTDSTGSIVKWHTGAILDLAMGRVGVAFVAIAVCMGIFTGMNGFFMTSSRLIFSMARAKMLPRYFAKVHEKNNTPGVCIIFTLVICSVCPFFGREVISWVVDMCSVGTAFGYFFTCAGAYVLVKNYDDKNDANRIKPVTALLGCEISVAILLLLIVPGSPAFMAKESWIALLVWIAMGIGFYLVSSKSLNKISKRELDFLILGNVQINKKNAGNVQQRENPVIGQLVLKEKNNN